MLSLRRIAYAGADRLVKANHHSRLRGKSNIFPLRGYYITATGHRSNGQALERASENRGGACFLAYPEILRDVASSRLSLSLFVATLCVPRVGVIHGNQSCAERQGLSAGQNQVAETQAQHGFVPQCRERLLLFGFGQFTLKPCTRRYDYGAVAPVRWYSDGRRESV